MCFMIDEECMQSVADETAVGLPEPFVIAVTTSLCIHDIEYSGTFKVAIQSLMPNFYAVLQSIEPIDVATKVFSDGIWRDIGSWDSELEGKRIDSLIL